MHKKQIFGIYILFNWYFLESDQSSINESPFEDFNDDTTYDPTSDLDLVV